jgi:hypothetical protein
MKNVLEMLTMAANQGDAKALCNPGFVYESDRGMAHCNSNSN